jgi:hypothetical protein
MNQFQLASFELVGKDGASFLYRNPDTPGLSVAVNAFFAQRGYRLGEGSYINGMYETGSAGLRVLVGGFVDRFKFQVTIMPHEGMSALRLQKAMSGAGGGVLGYGKMQKEFAQIVEALKLL